MGSMLPIRMGKSLLVYLGMVIGNVISYKLMPFINRTLRGAVYLEVLPNELSERKDELYAKISSSGHLQERILFCHAIRAVLDPNGRKAR